MGRQLRHAGYIIERLTFNGHLLKTMFFGWSAQTEQHYATVFHKPFGELNSLSLSIKHTQIGWEPAELWGANCDTLVTLLIVWHSTDIRLKTMFFGCRAQTEQHYETVFHKPFDELYSLSLSIKHIQIGWEPTELWGANCDMLELDKFGPLTFNGHSLKNDVFWL